jgi:hypothetical protein
MTDPRHILDETAPVTDEQWRHLLAHSSPARLSKPKLALFVVAHHGRPIHRMLVSGPIHAVSHVDGATFLAVYHHDALAALYPVGKGWAFTIEQEA